MAGIQFDNPDEREAFHAKESWVPVILGGIPVAIVCGGISALIYFFVSKEWLTVSILVSIAITLLSRIPHIIDNWKTDVIVTDRRLYYRHGIIDIKDHVADLTSITDVTVNPNILGRIFNYADITVQTQAGEDDFELKEIKNAYEMRRVINVNRDALERNVGVPPMGRRPRSEY